MIAGLAVIVDLFVQINLVVDLLYPCSIPAWACRTAAHDPVAAGRVRRRPPPARPPRRLPPFAESRVAALAATALALVAPAVLVAPALEPLIPTI